MRDAVIVTLHNHVEDCARPCLEALLEHAPDALRVVFDNESTDPKMPDLERWAKDHDFVWIRVDDQRQGGGLTGTWNRGIEFARDAGRERIVLMNHDVIVDATFQVLLDAMVRDFAVYSATSDRIGHGPNEQNSNFPHQQPIVPVSHFSGFCFGAKVSTFAFNRFNESHYFDPSIMFGGNEDEWVGRFRKKGGKCLIVAGCKVKHLKIGEWRKIPWATKRFP